MTKINKDISKLKSTCCRANLKVCTVDDGTSFYICTKCNMPTDSWFPKSVKRKSHKETLKRTIIAVHPIQKKLFELFANNQIGYEDQISLRKMASKIGMPKESPQKIKHHLLQLIKYGYINIINGKYTVNYELE